MKIKRLFILVVVMLCLLPTVLYAEGEKIRVKSIYNAQSSSTYTSFWIFELRSEGVYINNTTNDSNVFIQSDSSGNPVAVVFSNKKADASKGTQFKGKGRVAKKNPVFISDGHPAPFDWLDPEDMSESLVEVRKQVSGTIFLYRMTKTISVLTNDEAEKAGYINDDNRSFYRADKSLYLVALKKNDKNLVVQLWQPGSDIWLYEKSGDRISYRIGN